MRTEIDKRQERRKITHKTDTTDEPTHRDRSLRPMRPTVRSEPTEMGFMRDGIGSLE